MKTIFILSLFACLATFAKGQGTTQDEYNYIKNGLPAQRAAGLDIQKSGYTFFPASQFTIDGYEILISPVMRLSGHLAGTSLIVKSPLTGKTFSFCIENVETTPGLVFWNDLSREIMTPRMTHAIIAALGQQQSMLLTH